jgi:phage gp36-like protein
MFPSLAYLSFRFVSDFEFRISYFSNPFKDLFIMTLTYSTRADVETIASPTAVIRWVDDDADGTLSASEVGYIDRAIERAANRMNASLEMRYRLADLEGNTWCRDANSLLAAYLLATRRGNPAPDHLQEQYELLLADLQEIRDGRLVVPQAGESVETIPTVSNFTVDPARAQAKVRRVEATSTGSPPSGGRKSFPDAG